MKRIWTIILSAILASIIVLAFIYIFSFVPRNRIIRIEQVSGVPAREVFFASTINGKIVPLDFVGTSQKVMNAVVNIQSTHTVKYAGGENEVPDPFRQFFNDHDFFRYFFGPGQIPQNQQPEQQIGIGSGVIITPDGYIVTNNHVVAGADELDVTLVDNRFYKAKVVGTDPETDLAVVQIKEKDLPVIPLTSSNDIQVGEWVLAVGNPYGLTSTVTAGIISAKSRTLGILTAANAIESYIQTDAAINPGNSGGALVNLQGALVGINSAIASPTGAYSGYGFAVPSDIVNKVAKDIIKFGSVRRGYLGITFNNITAKFAFDRKLNINQGAYVDSVVKDGAAAKAGIRKGDIITSIDDKKIKEAAELQEFIILHNPGDRINVTVDRNGATKTFSTVLQELKKTEPVKQSNTSLESALGADFKTIDRKLARKLQIPGGVQITKLYPGKLKNETDVSTGFIITSVNNQPVKTVEDLKRVLEKIQSGGIMLQGVYENKSGTFYYAFGM